MESDVSNKIAKKIIGYVQGRASLRKLRDYFAPIVWDIESSNDSEAESLAYGVELFLAEYDYGHLSESELKAKLTSLIPMLPVKTSSVMPFLKGSAVYRQLAYGIPLRAVS